MKYYCNMTNELILDILEVLSRHGVVGQLVYRNEKIRIEYKLLRTRGIKGKEAREILADQNNIDAKTIESILYSKRKGDD